MTNKMDELTVKELSVQTHIGFNPRELGILQELRITMQLKFSVKKAAGTDEVTDSFNYKTVTHDVYNHVKNKTYNLIESVATDVARILVVRHEIPLVQVTVEKPNCLRFAKSSLVTIERCLNDFSWQDVHVSIGSNINPQENIPGALKLIAKKSQIVKVSDAFLTTPAFIKSHGQADFVNMAIMLKTKLDPEGLKLLLHDIEQKLGRKRDPQNKNAPRTIDLDITLWNDCQLEYKLEIDGTTKSWCIPDPDITKYAHITVPLADVSPNVVHPSQKKTLSAIAEKITGKGDFQSCFVKFDLKTKEQSALSETTNCDSCETSDQDRVALVTGASKRIGATIARRLHGMGFSIVVHYNSSRQESSELVTELNCVRKNSAHGLQADLTAAVHSTAGKLIQEAVGIWGRLDVLVNNASIFEPTTVGKVNEDVWNKLIQTNLTAPFFLSQAAYPTLKESHGCIVNIVDIHALRPLTNNSVYCISKAGLHMATFALAKDFAPDVRVNGVAPGAILWPEGVAEYDLEKKESLVKKIPMGRVGDPGDIASAVEYLVKADYVTGQIINVDGGRTLNQ